jgi:hypothetical protein
MKIENPIRNLKKLFVLAAMLACCGGWTKDALAAEAHCFCKVSCANLTGQSSASMVVKDLGPLFTYKGLDPMKAANQVDCAKLCTTAAAPYTGSQAIATAACALGCPNGFHVIAYSAVGTKPYRPAQELGVLKNTPVVSQTICKCPTGWTCNGCSPQTDGGVTTDGKCKKVACQPDTISPPPPNGTPIGTWGFSWGNAFIAWGTAANGGAPACKTTIISPAVCKF